MNKMIEDDFYLTHDKEIKYNKKKVLSTTKKIILGFLLVIIIGMILLSLPIASNDEDVNILTALFTSTTSVCVTGLVVVDTFSYWTLFGKIVILLLIQIGGMGIIAIICGIMMVLNKKVDLSNRLVIQDAYNLNSNQGVIKFVKKVIFGTVFVEFIGACLYMIKFIPKYGVVRGVWYSVFNSVSAFCNAGIDILGPNSLINYYDSPLVLITTMMLIFNGGIGFVVWWDVIDVIKDVIKRKITIKDFVFKLNVHTRIVLFTTFSLIIIGALLIIAFEYNNINTIGDMSLGHKILNGFFQSITLRTAGFASFRQGDMTDPSIVISILLMFVGGSPVGTAGGIKTVTFAVLICTVRAVVKGRNETVIYNRSINKELINKSLAVFFISFSIYIVLTLLLLITNDFSLGDSLFEVASALCTVGLTTGITSQLNSIGQIIIIIGMYLGRIGPISMFIAFSNRHNGKNAIHYAQAELMVG